MTGVERLPGSPGVVRLALEAAEVEILRELARQLSELLTSRPDDSAARALFPSGYADPAAQAEFDRFTRAELGERKVAAAGAIAEALDRTGADGVLIELDTERAWPWLTFLTDVRQVLAARLSEGGPPEEQSIQAALSDWAAYLQGALVDALSDTTDGGAES
ncbi:MAG TPA: DUF2017 family protein [Microbacteriaceae bacterium]|nr:DUF2017 family protein [Microbacteriaceae bacterium]